VSADGWQPGLQGSPTRRTRRGAGSTPRESPASSRHPRGRREVRRPQGCRAAEAPAVLVTVDVRKVHPSICPLRWTDRDDAPTGASKIRLTARRTRRAVEATAACPQGRAAARFGPCGRNRAPLAVIAPTGATKPGHRDTRAVATRRKFPTVTKRTARVPQGTRAAEVDALVSTPLRSRRLDPGSGRLPRKCALLRKGPRPRVPGPSTGSRAHRRVADKATWASLRSCTPLVGGGARLSGRRSRGARSRRKRRLSNLIALGPRPERDGANLGTAPHATSGRRRLRRRGTSPARVRSFLLQSSAAARQAAAGSGQEP